MSLEAGAAS